MKRAIVIGILIFTLNSCERAEKETYLIPDGFIGRVQIIFDQNGVPVKYKNGYGRDTIYTPKVGLPTMYEDGRRLYEIPESGILLTQFKSNYGFIDRRYFIVDGKGKRFPLEIYKIDHSKKDSAKWIVKDKNKKGIFGDGTSGSYGNVNIAYQEFFVSSYQMLDSIIKKENDDKFEEKLHKVTGSTF